MKNIIVMLGIRRSGNSPVRNWIADQFPATKVFLNGTPQAVIDADGLPDDNVLVSCEEMPVELFDQVKATKKVLILRDPANLWASRVKHYAALSSKKQYISPMVTDFWRNHAKKFLDPGDVITVQHDRFLTDEAYRRTLSEQLGGTFSDNTLDYVDDNGQGSSFDGLDYDGRAQDMPVFDRWKQYEDLQCFRDLFTEEVQELSTRIFGGDAEWTRLYS